MDPLIIVSSDSHAGVPKELWPQYLDKRFHDLLPALKEDNEIYPTAIFLLGAKGGATTILPEVQECHQTGWHGLHDATLRLADMDREGIAAELIYHGDFRLGDMFHNATNNRYPLDAWDEGARGWNRWAADNFGFAMDRFLVTGAIGSCSDMASTVADLNWIADHDFTGTYLPGYMQHADMPPLFDPYWEPFWTVCEERGIALVVHAGYGTGQGVVFPQLRKIYDDVRAAAGADLTDRAALMPYASAVSEDSMVFFNTFLNHNVDSRRPIWQMMFGGVFDRHPGLRLLPTEIRLDWLPATLAYLDGIYDANRDTIPATRKPSEYWHSNCMAGASFIHKAEVEMRHEIGIETISFGRDYPHPESTWPHTMQYLQAAFDGVPENEVRMILGESIITFLGLDRDRLLEIAKRIGPSYEQVATGADRLAPVMFESFAGRSGFLKPAEGSDRLPLVDPMVKEDLATLAGAAV